MEAGSASSGTGRALSLQGTRGTGFLGKVDPPSRHKGHFLLRGALDRLPLPIQNKGLLVKLLAWPNGPGLAKHLQVLGALTNQVTTQIGPIDVQFRQTSPLPVQILANRFGDTGFRRIGSRDPHRADEAAIPVVEHMTLVSIHPPPATFAP